MGGNNIIPVLVLVAISSLLFISNQIVDAHISVSPEVAPASQGVACSPLPTKSSSSSSLPPINHVSFPPSQAYPPSGEQGGAPSAPTPTNPPSAEAQYMNQGTGPAPDGLHASLFSSSSEIQQGGLGAGLDAQSSFKFDINFDNFPGQFLSQIAGNANAELKRTCDATDYPPLCLATVGPFLQGHRSVDVSAILEIAVRVTNEFAKHALALLKKLALTPGNPEEVVAVLNACKENYEGILYNFENAISALADHDVGTLNTMLSAVLTDCGDCEDAFKGLHFQCPITVIAEKLINMTSNCLAISGSLEVKIN